MSCAMRNFRPGQTVQEITGNRFLRRKANAVHKTVELRPVLLPDRQKLVDLGVVAPSHSNEIGVKLGSKLGNTILEPLHPRN